MEAAASISHTIASNNQYGGKIAGLYDLLETLGSGHFAVVKLARHVFTGAKVAVKVVDKTKLDEVSKSHLFQEVRCMKLVQHPNVVRLYEVIDTQTKLYLILELGDGGDLYDYIMRHERGLSEDLAKKYFRQILRAITYCHQLHVVHRDLKPENVVFFEKLGVVKLTDFGFSNKFSPGQKLETFCGSLAYSAPEILLGDSYDAPAVDIWSLGVILYMLVCGQPPFEKANDSETLTMIMDCKYTVPPQVTPSCRNLIASMLVRDPKKRASLEEIAADSWLKDDLHCDASEYLPLISRQEISEEDHAFILQKMIGGNIASKEDIMQSLDKNLYNHITATYFLLAEIRLRRQREELNLKTNLDTFLSNNGALKHNCNNLGRKQDKKIKVPDNNVLVPISIKVCSTEQYSNENNTDKRSRKCSIVREEDEEEPMLEQGETNVLKIANVRKESISDGRLNQSVHEISTQHATIVAPLKSCPKIAAPEGLTAQKFNKINKHNIDSNTQHFATQKKSLTSADASQITVHDALKGFQDLDISKIKPITANTKNPVLTQRRAKLNKIRTPSCSSSEASDDDTKARSKKKMHKFVGDTPTRLKMHRRDSHDDSSDSQDQTFSSSGSHNQSANPDKSSNKTHAKENKSEETRKSTNTQKNQKQKDAKQHSFSNSFLRRRRIRESHSLDRITEAQEFEMRHRHLATETQVDRRNSLFNLNSMSVAETKEEYEEESQVILKECSYLKYNINVVETAIHLKRTKPICNSNSFKSMEEIDIILEDNSLVRAIQSTGSKCFFTIKKIRRLGKYFPVVNFF
ncbi:SNF-related serine/threonine-protein kinase [Teleopsis dalmanni]|uniref:SNF-related serine/threonine-protein kinase n=1 Tax=Teleopsis dalmanni TaxID=139649 RepID=UPI0018CD1A3B|nr:SNF-related serine/threonine-protein kinase [Teleopsis dalmanni]